MKGNVITLCLLLTLTIGACTKAGSEKTKEKKEAEEGSIMWVNSYKQDCYGEVPMKCLQVQKKEKIEEGAWQNFFDEIEGFEFEEGYVYKLRVKIEKLDPATVPADGSSARYTLLEMLEKKRDEGC